MLTGPLALLRDRVSAVPGVQEVAVLPAPGGGWRAFVIAAAVDVDADALAVEAVLSAQEEAPVPGGLEFFLVEASRRHLVLPPAAPPPPEPLPPPPGEPGWFAEAVSALGPASLRPAGPGRFSAVTAPGK